MQAAARTLARQCAHWLQDSARRHYVAGTHLEDALRLAGELRAQGYRLSLGYWNGLSEPPEAVLDAYREAIDAAAGLGDDVRIAIKTPALRSDQDGFLTLLQRCRDTGVGLHLDAMRPKDADAMFGLLRLGAEESDQLGCTLPGRWRRSLADGEWAASRALVVRVVKGQWPDPDGEPPGSVAQRYLQVVDRLAGGACRVLVATHDPALAAAALDRLQAQGTSCELELLHGLPSRRVLPLAHARGVPVRLYLPYGYAWLPYALSTVRRNPRILFWLLRDALGGGPRLPVGPRHTLQ